MNIVLLGPPGAGKGTQAHLISQALSLPKISAGDMLRAAAQTPTPLGEELRLLMNKGQLVPDAITIGLICQRLKQADCKNGFILDGFPRTLTQAYSLENNNILITTVIELHLSDETIIERLAHRWIHPPSGRIYHTIFNPPRFPEKDDLTEEKLIQREDDKKETIQERLRVHYTETQPVMQHYKQLAELGKIDYFRFEAAGTVDEVKNRILFVLNG